MGRDGRGVYRIGGGVYGWWMYTCWVVHISVWHMYVLCTSPCYVPHPSPPPLGGEGVKQHGEVHTHVPHRYMHHPKHVYRSPPSPTHLHHPLNTVTIP